MALEHMEGTTGVEVPDPKSAVATQRGSSLRLPMYVNSHKTLLVAAKFLLDHPSRQVPQLENSVSAGTECSVGRPIHLHVPDTTVVPLQPERHLRQGEGSGCLASAFGALDVPQHHGVIFTRGEKATPLPINGQAKHRLGVWPQLQEGLAIRDIPQPHGIATACARCNVQVPIGRHARHLLRVSAPLLDHTSTLQVPHLEGPVSEGSEHALRRHVHVHAESLSRATRELIDDIARGEIPQFQVAECMGGQCLL
mmetsp:Transcript_16473/g.45635  ORF Transcript_16473/g.45635 Transcript_16473/m.45635 type:complete len:253 (+) Transcript_16473:154-912(+)|eukprot:CAMPEP_0177448980 /NCGR_PEP_ID=MMETSP0369-20130122/8478_2 /TAXON_ID=447022 ORGANISM="Scrippsiella hangoei-like, Strain SHHI-4" /NCGR_SAMPLE_ID=MMETSP0369 /ASSEMBLY_ACC=CAM_ASM_000364 /LENGTH=252 /DNA_ID=CAMNT_0018921451 /DNA_START=83 /DNA_END=841 /DNA_ORIENTATION=-